MTRVTLYSKPGCCLCDEAKEVIQRARFRHAFELEVRNILDDARDFSAYQFAIPVIAIDGHEIGRYHIDDLQFELALQKAGVD